MLKKFAATFALILLLADPRTGGTARLLAQSQDKPVVQRNSAPPAKPKPAQIRVTVFGKTLNLVLDVGLLGFAVIILLAILFFLALLFAVIARRRLRLARAANQKLEIEIRERKRAEAEVQQLNASLENRVAERTREVDLANQQLAEINKELETFAYSVSHDLRAPLRGIDGWSLALQEDYEGQLDERARQYLGRVRSETQRMGVLIDDLLELSRVTRLEMQRRQVDLTSIANRVAAQLQEAHANRRIDFVIAPQLTAQGDAGLLEIALTNLLNNAVKYTGPCPEARIQFDRSQQDGEFPFFVRDNGVGFNMAFAGTLFGAFQRLHKATEFPGSGVGLATVQRVIHRHGGRVWAEAEVGKGATFYFTIGSTA